MVVVLVRPPKGTHQSTEVDFYMHRFSGMRPTSTPGELEVFVVPRILHSEGGTNLDECIFATPGDEDYRAPTG